MMCKGATRLRDRCRIDVDEWPCRRHASVVDEQVERPKGRARLIERRRQRWKIGKVARQSNDVVAMLRGHLAEAGRVYVNERDPIAVADEHRQEGAGDTPCAARNDRRLCHRSGHESFLQVEHTE
jgi:hypothetical protein